MKNIIQMLIILLIVCSCKKEIQINKKNEVDGSPASEYQTEYYDKEKLDKALKSAIDEKNIEAYSNSFRVHVIANKYHEFLYYSILMAEKNKYDQAFYDTYYLLTCEAAFKSNLAMYYLLKGYELDNQDAIDEVEELFPDKKKIPSACSYLFK